MGKGGGGIMKKLRQQRTEQNMSLDQLQGKKPPDSSSMVLRDGGKNQKSIKSMTVPAEGTTPGKLSLFGVFEPITRPPSRVAGRAGKFGNKAKNVGKRPRVFRAMA